MIVCKRILRNYSKFSITRKLGSTSGSELNKLTEQLQKVSHLLKTMQDNDEYRKGDSPSHLDFHRFRMEAEDDLVWLREANHNLELQAILNEPSDHIISKDIGEYITTRGFGQTSQFSRFQEVTLRMASMSLSYPLTVSYCARHLLKEQPLEELNVLVLGARSEAVLPKIWWRESLVASEEYDRLTLIFMGPDIRHVLQFSHDSDVNSISWSSKPLESGDEREVNFLEVENSFVKLHEHEHAEELTSAVDFIVLFNPGFGSEYLKKDWEPTLRLLLNSRKPIIATASSTYDLKRDLKQLDIISSQENKGLHKDPISMLIQPHLNPFRCLRKHYDDKEEFPASLLAANQYIYCFQFK